MFNFKSIHKLNDQFKLHFFKRIHYNKDYHNALQFQSTLNPPISKPNAHFNLNFQGSPCS